MESHKTLHKAELDLIKNIGSNRFIYNDEKERKKVGQTVNDHLDRCEEFMFSVAFINEGGLIQLKSLLLELARKGVKGKIITTNYQLFTDPKALEDIMKMSNVELRMFWQDDHTEPGFHTKGYIFRRGDIYDILIGSSNITQNALCRNKEWNVEVSGKKDAIAIANVLDEFNKMWSISKPISEIIETYKRLYDSKPKVQAKADGKIVYSVLKPNAMQTIFVTNLVELFKNGQKRALLISATGTGKTYASAFGARELESLGIKRVLFIAHREKILKQSKETYEIVFENKIKTAIFAGKHRDIEGADFVFASRDLLIRQNHRGQFKPDEFDLIIIDEAHKIGANRYQDVINYFTPKFLLGMSATPDRTDGYDLYKLFNYNIAYEIRLLDALGSNMLTPFNYFGITDITVNGKILDDKSDFNLLTHEERVKNIINYSEYYGYSGDRLRALAFVPSIEIGKKLSEKFNEKGYRTVFLSGNDSEEYREKCIEHLERKEKSEDYLDIIFTVDIFNEGIDIPTVNQIILLRPTESSIIFIQQLGRGLRLANNKEYVVVLDFIGNYENNYLITTAFSKKVSRAECIKNRKPFFPGASSVHFEKIAADLIYRSIDQGEIGTNRAIRNDYRDVKQKLGHIPSLDEFAKYGEHDVRVFLDNCNSAYKSYYDFLVKYDEGYKIRFNDQEIAFINHIGNNIANGMRFMEIDLLDRMVTNQDLLLKNPLSTQLEKSVVSVLNGTFYNTKTNILPSLIQLKDNNYIISNSFKKCLENEAFKDFIIQYVVVAKRLNYERYNKENRLIPDELYTRRDAAKMLGSTKNFEATVFGYHTYDDINAMPIFVTYNKENLEVSSRVNYKDSFIDDSTFIWYTRDPRTLESQEIKNMIKAHKEKGTKWHLFVQKCNSRDSNNRDGDHYYLGEVTFEEAPINGKMPDDNNDVVIFKLKLAKPCRKDIYDYLISPL